MNTAGNHTITCDLQLWNKSNIQFHTAFEIEDRPTILKLERRGAKLAASYSQDKGENWKRFPEQPIEYLPSKIKVGVSMSSNTDPACKGQFQDFKLDASDQ